MKKLFTLFLALLFIPFFANAEEKSNSKTLFLTGYDLTIEDLIEISEQPIQVQIDPKALETMQRTHELVLQAAKEGHPIYGLNRGVGQNKDKTIFNGDTLDPESKQASITFNRNVLFSHSSALAPDVSNKLVFPIMLARLNTLIQGKTGAQPQVAEILAQLINKRIQPIIPGRGSVGEADITILSHLGLAMMGEGDVVFEGKKMSAKEALALNGIEPLIPFGKDAHAIVVSNAYSAAMAALVFHQTEELLNKADYVFALSLEGLNGNIAPFLPEVQNLRPYPGQQQTAANVLKALKGSYLFQPSEERELQDPLSFRSYSQVHGSSRDILANLKTKLLIQLNSSDDNPAVILDIKPKENASLQELAYYLKEGGAIIPSANFEPVSWILDFESLANSLRHVSHLAIQRIIKLSNEKFTKLPRFLSPNDNTIAFGTIQKTFTALDAEIRNLSEPVSADYTPVAGEIEDHATNAPYVLTRLCKINDNLRYIFGMELMHAAQAVDLRKQSNANIKIGCLTSSEYNVFRSIIPFLDTDRALSSDIQKSYEFLYYKWPQRLLKPDCLFKLT